MIKMHHPGALRGAEPGFWDANWEGGSLEEALRFCEHDPLRCVIEEYVPEGSLVLEGGCGLGQYVVFYGRRGRRVIGLDFAAFALDALKRAAPAAAVCRGDVAALPFADASFDAYCSVGVVEHFEDGPQRALAEAARVLRKDGRLLVSVPYASPIRRIKAALGLAKGSWRTTRGISFTADETPHARFWQYAFTRREFCSLLEASGFRVLGVRPYALVWGLYEIPGVARIVRVFRGAGQRLGGTPRRTVSLKPRGLTVQAERPTSRLRSLLRRIVVQEDTSLPLVGRLVALGGIASANMMMFICTKRPEATLWTIDGDPRR